MHWLCWLIIEYCNNATSCIAVTTKILELCCYLITLEIVWWYPLVMLISSHPMCISPLGRGGPTECRPVHTLLALYPILCKVYVVQRCRRNGVTPQQPSDWWLARNRPQGSSQRSPLLAEEGQQRNSHGCCLTVCWDRGRAEGQRPISPAAISSQTN